MIGGRDNDGYPRGVGRTDIENGASAAWDLKSHSTLSMRRAVFWPTTGEILELSYSEAKQIVHPGGDVLNGVAN